MEEKNMYDPTLGRFLEEDPVRADANPYRYCANNPPIYVDPSGEYSLTFEATSVHIVWGPGAPACEWIGWSTKAKDKISASLTRIGAKCNVLRQQIATEIASLSECMRCELLPEIQKLDSVLEKMEKGITSSSEGLAFRHFRFGASYGGQVDSEAYEQNFLGLCTPRISLNDGVMDPWGKKSPEDLDTLLFHEVSHIYGTEDDDSAGVLMNAASIAKTMRGSFTGNTFYRNLKKQARETCGE
jgi:hypothetical protein